MVLLLLQLTGEAAGAIVQLVRAELGALVLTRRPGVAHRPPLAPGVQLHRELQAGEVLAARERLQAGGVQHNRRTVGMYRLLADCT